MRSTTSMLFALLLLVTAGCGLEGWDVPALIQTELKPSAQVERVRAAPADFDVTNHRLCAATEDGERSDPAESDGWWARYEFREFDADASTGSDTVYAGETFEVLHIDWQKKEFRHERYGSRLGAGPNDQAVGHWTLEGDIRRLSDKRMRFTVRSISATYVDGAGRPLPLLVLFASGFGYGPGDSYTVTVERSGTLLRTNEFYDGVDFPDSYCWYALEDAE